MEKESLDLVSSIGLDFRSKLSVGGGQPQLELAGRVTEFLQFMKYFYLIVCCGFNYKTAGSKSSTSDFKVKKISIYFINEYIYYSIMSQFTESKCD